MTDSNTESIVEMDDEAVDDALEELEAAMKAAKMTLNHGEARPSTVTLAHKTRDAYNILVTAHPGYELVEDDDDE